MIINETNKTTNYQNLIIDDHNECNHSFIGSSCIKCNAHKLYPYQVEGASFIDSVLATTGKVAIFDEPGLGKTIQALAYLKYNNDAMPFLWVTKSRIRTQHLKEMNRILGDDINIQILYNGSSRPIRTFNCIISYDLFKNINIDALINHGFQTIILDECQQISNGATKRTQSVKKVISSIPKLIALSGSPWKNRGSEFFTILSALNHSMFPSLNQFKWQWVSQYYDTASGKYKEGGIRDIPRFKELVKPFIIRRERAEVMPELPLVNRTKFVAEMPDYAREAYNKENDKLINDYNQHIIDGTENTFAAQQSFLQHLVVMRQIVGMAKVESTVDLAIEFLEETDRKLIIFVHHIAVGESIYNALNDYCKEYGINEPLHDKKHSNFAVDFWNDDNRILIASTLASGEGINLQCCSDIIMHERQWNPQNEEQAEGRIIRIGQKEQSVNVTYTHGDGTIDMHLDAIIERKRHQYNEVMNDSYNGDSDDSSMIMELVQSIVKSSGK